MGEYTSHDPYYRLNNVFIIWIMKKANKLLMPIQPQVTLSCADLDTDLPAFHMHIGTHT